MITPTKAMDRLNQTLVINLPRELPLQHDLQAPQYAHRVLKDYQRAETISNA